MFSNIHYTYRSVGRRLGPGPWTSIDSLFLPRIFCDHVPSLPPKVPLSKDRLDPVGRGLHFISWTLLQGFLVELLIKSSSYAPEFLVPSLPSVSRGNVWCYKLWSPFNNFQKGKLVMCIHVVLNVLLIRYDSGAIDPNFYHKYFNGITELEP